MLHNCCPALLRALSVSRSHSLWTGWGAKRSRRLYRRKVKGKRPVSRKHVNLEQTEVPEEQPQVKTLTPLAFPVAAESFRSRNARCSLRA